MQRILGTLLVLASAPTLALDDLPARLNQCAQISNHLERLYCFDKVTSDVNQSAAQAAKAPQSVATPVASAAAAPQPAPAANTRVVNVTDEFGFENKKSISTPERLDVTVSSKKRDPYGRWRITLTNGQVWKQSDSSRFKIKDDLPSFIRKGALGSFFFGQQGLNRQMRVKRVK